MDVPQYLNGWFFMVQGHENVKRDMASAFNIPSPISPPTIRVDNKGGSEGKVQCMRRETEVAPMSTLCSHAIVSQRIITAPHIQGVNEEAGNGLWNGVDGLQMRKQHHTNV